MENRLFPLSGVLLLMALLLLCSCVKIAEPVHSEFKLERSPQTLYGKTAQIRFNSQKSSEAAVIARVVSDRCEKGMMRWADYSSLDTTVE